MEQAPADTFHVFSSPVSKTLGILEKQGIALFRLNRGFFPGRSSAIVRFHHSHSNRSFVKQLTDKIPFSIVSTLKKGIGQEEE
jgi:hypothetical protein